MRRLEARGVETQPVISGVADLADPAAQDQRPRRGDRHLPDLAVPDLGLRRAGPAPARAPVDQAVRGRRRPPLRGRRRGRLLRAAQGHGGADQVHARPTSEPGGVRQVPQLPDPDDAGLRRRLRDPAVRDDAQPGRCRLRRHARRLPAVDRDRHIRVRRGGHAVDRPVLDDLASGADVGALPDLRGRRPGRRRAPRRRRATGWPCSTTTSSSLDYERDDVRRSDLDEDD